MLQKAQEQQPLDRQIELDRQFHFLLIHATENQFWIALLEPITEVYRKWIDTALQTASDTVKQKLQESHTMLFQALCCGDYPACEKAIDAHYDLVDNELEKEI